VASGLNPALGGWLVAYRLDAKAGGLPNGPRAEEARQLHGPRGWWAAAWTSLPELAPPCCLGACGGCPQFFPQFVNMQNVLFY